MGLSSGTTSSGSSELTVTPLDASSVQAWRQYVLAHPMGTPFHLPAWSSAVEKAYGHRPSHLGAFSHGRLGGVLPLFEVNSMFVGRVMVSVPYATYGGILADSSDDSRALLEHAKALCHQRGARYLELRHREQSGLNLPVNDRYDTFRGELPSQAADVMPNLPRKCRAAARNGIKALGEDCFDVGPQWLGAIHDLYAFTLRRLGSPPYRRSLFEALADGFGDDCICAVVRKAGKPIAGVVSFVFRDQIVPYFSGSLPEATADCANNVMYARLMEYAVSKGIKCFDFNRTRRDNDGPHSFKRNHGFAPTPLHYQMYLAGDQQMPNLTPSNGKFAMASKVWRKLPLWLTTPAGGTISKWIP